MTLIPSPTFVPPCYEMALSQTWELRDGHLSTTAVKLFCRALYGGYMMMCARLTHRSPQWQNNAPSRNAQLLTLKPGKVSPMTSGLSDMINIKDLGWGKYHGVSMQVGPVHHTRPCKQTFPLCIDRVMWWQEKAQGGATLLAWKCWGWGGGSLWKLTDARKQILSQSP